MPNFTPPALSSIEVAEISVSNPNTPDGEI